MALSKAALYTPDVLGLAVELAGRPFDAAAPATGEARSRTCGSTIAISAADDFTGIGMKVSACAIGQAAAAIFLRHADGVSLSELQHALRQIDTWLAGDGSLPEWGDFAMIAPARDFPGRHGAIALPWRAAIDALSKR